MSALISEGSPYPVLEPVLGASNLGNNRKLVTHLEDQRFTKRLSEVEGDPNLKEFVRYAARAHGRRVLQALDIPLALAFCGAGLKFGHKRLKVHRVPEAKSGSVTGLCHCGAAMSCPVCGPRVGARRVNDVMAVAEWHTRRGGIGHLLTFTMPHREGEPLGSLRGDFRRAREIAFKGRHYARLKDLRVGFFGSHEVNHSDRNGWHFHRHEYVLGSYGSAEYSFIHERWMEGLKSVDRWSRHAEEHAFDAQRCDASGGIYAAKVGFEIAYAPAKESRSLASLIVEDWANPMTRAMTWVDGIFGVRGVRSVEASKGLYAAAGLREVGDEEAAEEAISPYSVLLGTLEPAQYAVVIAARKEYDLRLAANDGIEAVNTLLTRLGAGKLDGGKAVSPILGAGKPVGQLELL